MARLVCGRVPVSGRDGVASSCVHNNVHPPPPLPPGPHPHLPRSPPAPVPAADPTPAAPARPRAPAPNPDPAAATFGRKSDSVDGIKTQKVKKALGKAVAFNLKQAMSRFLGKRLMKDELGSLRVGFEQLAKTDKKFAPIAHFLDSESVKTSQNVLASLKRAYEINIKLKNNV